MDNKQLLFIGGAGLIAVLLLRGKGSPAGTAPATGGSTTPSPSYVPTPTYVPTGNEVADLLNQLTPPTQPAITPPIYPTGAGTAPVAVLPQVDRYGIPHRPGSATTSGDNMWEPDGQLYKTLSDLFKLYWEDVEAAMAADGGSGGNYANQRPFYTAEPHRFAGAIDIYNRLNPGTPIRARW